MANPDEFSNVTFLCFVLVFLYEYNPDFYISGEVAVAAEHLSSEFHRWRHPEK